MTITPTWRRCGAGSSDCARLACIPRLEGAIAEPWATRKDPYERLLKVLSSFKLIVEEFETDDGVVLEVMIEQTDAQMRTEQRSYLMCKIRQGQMFENVQQSQKALMIWQEAVARAQTAVDECRAQLQEEIAKLAAARAEDSAQEGNSTVRNGAIQSPEGEGAQSDTDSSSTDLDTPDVENHLGTFRMRLRLAIEIQHVCVFFVANAYYQIKSNETLTKPDSDHFKELEKQEVENYEKARIIRTEVDDH